MSNANNCNLCRSFGGMLAKAQEAYAAHMKPFCRDYARLPYAKMLEQKERAEELARDVRHARVALSKHQEKHDAQPAGAR